ncbi:MAG: leucine-rich repeat domain-containing protein [Alistipes putredinis]|nr:MAG: leucine-rich repeat domain-containing protein [Alistipes putredinis]
MRYGAFTDCSSLTSIEIPNSVKEIGICAFHGCTELQSVTFQKGSLITRLCGAYVIEPYGTTVRNEDLMVFGVFNKCTAFIIYRNTCKC